MPFKILDSFRKRVHFKERTDFSTYNPDYIKEVETSLGSVFIKILVEQYREPIFVKTTKDRTRADKISNRKTRLAKKYLIAIRPITPDNYRFVKIEEIYGTFMCVYEHKETRIYKDLPCDQILALYKPEYNLLKKKVKKARSTIIKNTLLQR